MDERLRLCLVEAEKLAATVSEHTPKQWNQFYEYVIHIVQSLESADQPFSLEEKQRMENVKRTYDLACRDHLTKVFSLDKTVTSEDISAFQSELSFASEGESE